MIRGIRKSLKRPVRKRMGGKEVVRKTIDYIFQRNPNMRQKLMKMERRILKIKQLQRRELKVHSQKLKICFPRKKNKPH